MGEQMSDEAEVPAVVPEVVQGPVPATRSEYADRISAAYREAVEAIFRTGDLLIDAKDGLPHGEFTPMIEEEVPFSPRTARKLMAIARDERLRKRTIPSVLPSAWTTLHRLTRLSDGEWKAIRPHISPDLTGGEIPKLLGRGAQLPLTSYEHRTAQEEFEAALKELPFAERDWVKRRLKRSGTPVSERVRVVKALAEVPQKKRNKLYELDEREDPPEESDAVQLHLPIIAHDARAGLLERETDLSGESPLIEGARSVLTLQAFLRWAIPLSDCLEHGEVLDGIWAARNPRKIARNARNIADWMNELATQIERAGTCPMCALRLARQDREGEPTQISPAASTCQACRAHAIEVGEAWAAA